MVSQRQISIEPSLNYQKSHHNLIFSIKNVLNHHIMVDFLLYPIFSRRSLDLVVIFSHYRRDEGTTTGASSEAEEIVPLDPTTNST